MSSSGRKQRDVAAIGQPTKVARHGVRRLPRPVSEPPFDDEVGAGGSPKVSPAAVNQGALALAFRLPNGLPAVPEPPPRLRLVKSSSPGDEDDFAARQPTSSAHLPDIRAWSAMLATAILEVLHGQRPAQQLLRWTDEEIYRSIVDRVAARPRTDSVARPTVRSVRVDQPVDHVAEVSIVVRVGKRYRAAALRLEGLDGRWVCTAFELI